MSHELILSQLLESPLSHEFNRFKSSRVMRLSHEPIRIKALESDAQKRSTKFSESLKRSTKFSESEKRSTKLSESPKRSAKSRAASNH